MTKGPKHPGLDGRARDENGQIRHKNTNTRVDTLRETYGESFGGNIRGDSKLGTLLEREGNDTLSQYLKNK